MMIGDQEEVDALVLIYTRNAFYKKKFYSVLGVFFLSLVMIGVLAGMLRYLTKNPPHPLYFVADSAGKLIQDIPLQKPNMSLEAVTALVVESVEAAYTYNFMNYRGQLQETQKYFTDYGWRSYMGSLQASNNLVALTQRKLVILAKVVAPPKLIAEGPLGASKIYAYKFEMPVLATYYNPPYTEKSKFENALIVSVIVMRQNQLTSYKGLGIVQMIGTLVQGSSDQNLLTPPS